MQTKQIEHTVEKDICDANAGITKTCDNDDHRRGEKVNGNIITPGMKMELRHQNSLPERKTGLGRKM